MIGVDEEQTKRLSDALQQHADRLQAGWLADLSKIERETRILRRSIRSRRNPRTSKGQVADATSPATDPESVSD